MLEMVLCLQKELFAGKRVAFVLSRYIERLVISTASPQGPECIEEEKVQSNPGQTNMVPRVSRIHLDAGAFGKSGIQVALTHFVILISDRLPPAELGMSDVRPDQSVFPYIELQ